MLYRAVRPLLFALPPERAHALALASLRGFARVMPRVAPRNPPIPLLGLQFPSRVGLAAGFDKNATAIEGLGRLGFGFVEVGTVTPRAQAGQGPPRLFRLRRSAALINRMGFPNDGAPAVAARLRQRRYAGILGVNIGKNADTPLDRAVDDYRECLRVLHGVADYVAVNVSSPNTQDLRTLQQPDRLDVLLAALLTERDALSRATGRRVPILVKVSPDLDAVALGEAAAVLQRLGVDGVIATNTTLTREGVASDPASGEDGGLSGPPLLPAALRVVRQLRSALGPALPIIGVGGIDTVAAGVAMRAAGADLIQLYTGLVYRGPSLVAALARAL